jgi:hypothetical protein
LARPKTLSSSKPMQRHYFALRTVLFGAGSLHQPKPCLGIAIGASRRLIESTIAVHQAHE